MDNKDYELICYSTDNSGIFGDAIGVRYPKTIEEVKSAIFNSTNVVPRGLGSSFVGGVVPSNSVVVDMKGMNKINFDSRSKVVYVEAGVTVRELNERLKAVGYELPFFGNGTIGGMIATNSIGLMGNYGNIREWIEEVEFINGRSEIIKFSKSDLGEICGMEGTTGIITGAKINVIPFIERSASIFQSSDLEEVFIIIKRLRLEKSISMIRLYSPYFSKLLGFPEKYNLIVGFDSNYGKITGEEYDMLFEKIRKDYNFIISKGYGNRDDAKFLFEKINDFVLLLDKFNVPFSGDFHSGTVYPYFNGDLKKEEISKLIERLNGKLGDLGVGIKRKNRVDNLHKKIIRRVKMRHDPFLKMNKGKLIDINEEDINEEDINEEDIEDIAEEDLIDKREPVGNVQIRDNFDRDSKVDKSLIDNIIFNKGEIEESDDNGKN